MSYIDQHGDWENRKISIIGVAKSFISQLSIGQDLTKISLPAAFQYPYSALELGAVRCLSYCHLLQKANKEEDPLQRLFCAVRWFLSCTQKEKFEKKPYNPILGESHLGWVQSEEFGRSNYLGEQTVHHPPICSYVMENTQEKIQMQGNIEFDIHFHGNSVSVLTKGPIKMKLGARAEQYFFSTVLPDLSIRNVIIGTKRLSWDGEVSIVCPETGYKAIFSYSEEGWYCTNVVNGIIVKGDSVDQPLYTFYGPCGGKVDITDCKTNQVETLFDYGIQVPNKLHYPTIEAQDERNSLKVWADVNKAIVIDDLAKADIAKRLVEDAQRKRRTNGLNYAPRFFELNKETNFWEYKPLETETHINLINRQMIDLPKTNSSVVNSLVIATQELSVGAAPTESVSSPDGAFVVEDL